MSELQLRDAIECLEKIGNISSTNEKKEVLSEYKDNIILQDLLVYTYNPFLQYYVKKLPKVDTEVDKEVTLDVYIEFVKLVEALRTREVTGNAALARIESFLELCNGVERDWYSKVLKRDLKVGVNVKTINTVIPDLIPVYNTMLANKVNPADLEVRDKKTLKKMPDTYCVQPKLDGVRLNIHVTDNGIELRTRNGKIVTGYAKLEEEAQSLPKGYVYDGEIISKEFFDFVKENTESQDKVVDRSHFQDTMKQVFAKTDNKEGVFVVFDMVDYADWVAEKSYKIYADRLQDMRSKIPTDLKSIQKIPMPINSNNVAFSKNKSEDIDKTLELFSKYLNLGYEGLMVKNLNAVYEFKRTNALLKLKEMDTLDLPVVSMFEGNGKYQGSLGYVTVEYKGSLTGVGSGFSDAERDYYWKNPQEIIGKTIEVSYQAETQNKDGEYSLSFPIYKGIRFDK